MESVTLPVPPDRWAEFFELYGRWLASPAGTKWSPFAPAAHEVLPWDKDRTGDKAIAAALWSALSEAQRTLVDTVATAGMIEPSQLAAALGLSGELAVMQAVAGVNASAEAKERARVVRLLAPDGFTVLDLDPDARALLTTA